MWFPLVRFSKLKKKRGELCGDEAWQMQMNSLLVKRLSMENKSSYTMLHLMAIVWLRFSVPWHFNFEDGKLNCGDHKVETLVKKLIVFNVPAPMQDLSQLQEKEWTTHCVENRYIGV